eukprot:5386742-Amphidinium_carterae.2
MSGLSEQLCEDTIEDAWVRLQAAISTALTESAEADALGRSQYGNRGPLVLMRHPERSACADTLRL